MSHAVVVVEGLRKHYGETEALCGVDLSVERGEIVALLGPNGAGKTTVVEILEGYRSRTAGEVTVLGVDPGAGGRAWRDRLGIMLQESGTLPELTVSESLWLFHGYYSRPRPVAELLELVDLTAQADTLAGRLSGGQRRRLDLAIALVGRPELVFLDEPTTGFDPAARRGAWALVEQLRDGGTSVLLTTHYMEEASRLADRIVVLADGRVVAEGTPDDLMQATETASVRFRVPDGTALDDLPVAVEPDASGWCETTTGSPTAVLHRLTTWSTDRGIELAGLTVTRPTLEDVYLRLTGDRADG